MKLRAIRALLLGCLGLACSDREARAGFVTATSPTDIGVTTDLFDVRQGAIIASASQLEIGFVPEAAIGGSRPDGPEPGNLVFANYPVGTVNTFTLKTLAPISLGSFRLVLGGSGTQRVASLARLFTSNDNVNFTLASTTAISPDYLAAYGSSTIAVTDSFAPVTAQFFRLDLTAGSSLGPRIIELDGFGVAASVPEPASLAMLGIGLAGLALGRLLRRAPR